MQSPCTSICSLLDASLTTDAPQANFLPNFLAASASLTPNNSRPSTDVTHLRLFRVARSTTICFFTAFLPLFFLSTSTGASDAGAAAASAPELRPGGCATEREQHSSRRSTAAAHRGVSGYIKRLELLLHCRSGLRVSHFSVVLTELWRETAEHAVLNYNWFQRRHTSGNIFDLGACARRRRSPRRASRARARCGPFAGTLRFLDTRCYLSSTRPFAIYRLVS